MKYITIDGDDIGQKITSAYLRNDLHGLTKINNIVKSKTRLISDLLANHGFVVIFCAADGVAAYCESNEIDFTFIYREIENISQGDISFSAGVGRDLRESYIALLSAKSNGKSRLHDFESIN